jgi:hypothetical protein
VLDDSELKNVMISLLRTQKARDKQRKIGASGIGDPCPYCLARQLAGVQSEKPSPYWLGAKIGDAIHALLEYEASKHLNDDEGVFKVFKGARLEKPVYIGDIPGYGSIWSTPDLFLTAENHLVDYKTSKRSKVDFYVASGEVPTKYLYQVQLYARALEDMGYKVDKISFVFINRDGTSDRDVVVISVDYDRKLADEAWDRVVSAWQWLQDGGDIETLPSDPECFLCANILHRV